MSKITPNISSFIETIENQEETIRYKDLIIKQYMKEIASRPYLHEQQKLLILKDKNKNLTNEIDNLKKIISDLKRNVNPTLIKKMNMEIEGLTTLRDKLNSKIEDSKTRTLELQELRNKDSKLIGNLNRNLADLIEKSILESTAEQFVKEHLMKFVKPIRDSKNLNLFQDFLVELILRFNEHSITLRSKKLPAKSLATKI